MKLISTLFIGIFYIFLNPSLCLAAVSSTYLFENEYCSNLSGTKWRPLGQRCPKDQILYSMKASKDLFCQYRLNPGDSLRSVLIKNSFYRSAAATKVITYSQGESFSFIPPGVKYLLFSKRDMLSKNTNLCASPKSKDLGASAFVMHIPNSFYVIKSGLKRYNDPNALPKQGPEAIVAPREIIGKTEKETKASEDDDSKEAAADSMSLKIEPVLFYDSMKGTQISNGSEAEISSKLSPGIHAEFTIRTNKKFQYSFFTGVNFNVYTEKAGELFIANNNVQSLSVGLSTTFEHYKFFTPSISVALFEDLYYTRPSSTELAIEREMITRFKLNSKFYFVRNDRFDFSISPNLVYDLAKGELEAGLGYEAPISFIFHKDQYKWGINLNYFMISKDLTDLELEKTAASMSINMGFKF